MSDNYLVWGTIESLASLYKTVSETGGVDPDVESQDVVKRMLVARIKFFKENGLLNVDIFDECGSFVDRCYYRNDFTWEGEALRKKKVGARMNSKASKKIPPDMRILEKALAEIRAGK